MVTSTVAAPAGVVSPTNGPGSPPTEGLSLHSPNTDVARQDDATTLASSRQLDKPITQLSVLLSEVASGIDNTMDVLTNQLDSAGAAAALEMLGRLGWIADFGVRLTGGMPVKGEAEDWMLSSAMQQAYQASKQQPKGGSHA